MSERDLVYGIIKQAILDARTDPLSFKRETERFVAQINKLNAIKWIYSSSKEEYSLYWWCDLIDMPYDWVLRKCKEAIKK